MLQEAYKAQTDLQTELTLAKSNLQLALANNEMLEDALNRDVPGSSKDVGWRRWGAKEQREREQAGESRRQSMDSTRSVEVPSPSLPSPSPVPSSDSRFFRFRFGGGSTSTNSATTGSFPPSPRVPGSPALTNGYSTQHLTSASLPSLVPEKSVHEEELARLTAELDKERNALKEATNAKEALEAELESLSQALFEEVRPFLISIFVFCATSVVQLWMLLLRFSYGCCHCFYCVRCIESETNDGLLLPLSVSGIIGQ